MANDNEFVNSMSAAADMCVARFSNDDEMLDYQPDSLRHLDLLLTEVQNFLDDMHPDQVKFLVSAFGSYLFEVVRRTHGGTYYWYEPEDQPVLILGEPEYKISMLAFGKIQKLLTDASESISQYYGRVVDQLQMAQPGDNLTVG